VFKQGVFLSHCGYPKKKPTNLLERKWLANCCLPYDEGSLLISIYAQNIFQRFHHPLALSLTKPCALVCFFVPFDNAHKMSLLILQICR
jgi:hypothetical protein